MAQNVGVDISKQRLDVAILETREVFQVSNDKTGWMNLAKRLERRQIAAIGLEASGGYERGLIRALLNAGLPVRRINPFRLRRFADACGIKAKNDKLDAGVIARFVATLPTRPLSIDPLVERLAEHVRARHQLSDELKPGPGTRPNRSASRWSNASAKLRIGLLQRQILLLDKAIKQMVAANPVLAAKDRLLCAVKGVGPVFSHPAGLHARTGRTHQGPGRAPSGRRPLRSRQRQAQGPAMHPGAVGEACATSPSWPPYPPASTTPTLKTFHQRLRAAGKEPKVALVAVMRKLITILNAILRDNAPWRNQPT